jgi:hypothetical protein
MIWSVRSRSRDPLEDVFESGGQLFLAIGYTPAARRSVLAWKSSMASSCFPMSRDPPPPHRDRPF